MQGSGKRQGVLVLRFDFIHKLCVPVCVCARSTCLPNFITTWQTQSSSPLYSTLFPHIAVGAYTAYSCSYVRLTDCSYNLYQVRKPPPACWHKHDTISIVLHCVLCNWNMAKSNYRPGKGTDRRGKELYAKVVKLKAILSRHGLNLA